MITILQRFFYKRLVDLDVGFSSSCYLRLELSETMRTSEGLKNELKLKVR